MLRDPSFRGERASATLVTHDQKKRLKRIVVLWFNSREDFRYDSIFAEAEFLPNQAGDQSA
jgi:hypothetical protein